MFLQDLPRSQRGSPGERRYRLQSFGRTRQKSKPKRFINFRFSQHHVRWLSQKTNQRKSLAIYSDLGRKKTHETSNNLSSINRCKLDLVTAPLIQFSLSPSPWRDWNPEQSPKAKWGRNMDYTANLRLGVRFTRSSQFYLLTK